MLLSNSNSKWLIYCSYLSPFKYVYPCTTILPSIYYGLINSQDNFIFGINQIYSDDFFTNNGIIINKNIFIIIIDEYNENKIRISTKEILFRKKELKNITLSYNPDNKYNINKNDNIYLNDSFNIDLPSKLKKKVIINAKRIYNEGKNRL